MIEIALVSISIGLVLVSRKVVMLQKAMASLLVLIAEVMSMLEIQQRINKQLVERADIDEELKRMMEGM